VAVCGTVACISPHEDFLVGMDSTEFRTPEGYDFLAPQLNVEWICLPRLAYRKERTMSNGHAPPILPHPSLYQH
jgi:hypothetical protein